MSTAEGSAGELVCGCRNHSGGRGEGNAIGKGSGAGSWRLSQGVSLLLVSAVVQHQGVVAMTASEEPQKEAMETSTLSTRSVGPADRKSVRCGKAESGWR